MKCDISKEMLIGYFYKDLDAIEQKRIESHLPRCQNCREELQKLSQTKEILQTWPEETPEPGAVFVPPKVSRWKSLFPLQSNALGWRRVRFGLAAGCLAVLLLLSLLNFELSYSQGNFSMKLSLLPRPKNESRSITGPVDSLKTPVTQRQFKQWQNQTERLVRQMVRTSESRQQQQLKLALSEFANDMDLKRRSDLQLVGQGLEVLQLSNEDRFEKAEQRFRYTDEILQQIITLASMQSSQPGK